MNRRWRQHTLCQREMGEGGERERKREGDERQSKRVAREKWKGATEWDGGRERKRGNELAFLVSYFVLPLNKSE